MKTLETLIKLYQTRLDEKWQEMAQQQDTRDKIQTILDNLAEQLKQERELALRDSSVAFNFGKYAETVDTRRKQLTGTLQQIDTLLERMNEELRELYEETKRIEIIKDMQDARAEKAEMLKEQMEMDELAMQQHQYNRNVPQ